MYDILSCISKHTSLRDQSMTCTRLFYFLQIVHLIPYIANMIKW